MKKINKINKQHKVTQYS